MSSTPAAPVAPAAPAAAPATKPSPEQLEAKLAGDIKAMLIYELQAKGYAPHPGDVAVIVARVKELVVDAGGSAAAYVSAQDAKLKAFRDHEEAQAAEATIAAQKAADAAELAKKVPSAPAIAHAELASGAPVPKVPAAAPVAAKAS